MAKIIKQQVPFTQVANVVLNDKKLSLGAKGLFAYLFSKPEGWQFSSVRIAAEQADGRDAVLAALRELEVAGYLIRQKHASGRMTYSLAYSQKRAEDDKARVGFSLRGKSPLISNKDKDKVINILNQASAEKTAPAGKGEIAPTLAVKGAAEVNALIAAFEPVNPSFARLFANKTQRGAAERLIRKHGLDKMLKAVQFLEEAIKRPYCPKIIDPYALERDMGKLVAFYQQERGKHEKAKSKIVFVE